MLNGKMFALLIVACSLVIAVEPASAQKGVPSGDGVGSGEWAPNVPPGSVTDPPNGIAITRDNMSGSRLNRQRNEERRQAERRRRAERGEAVAPSVATQAQILAAAQAVATSAGLDCRVTEASHPGVDPHEAPIYETACADGPGYLLIASTPTQSFNCFELAGAATVARMEDPAANVGHQCELPANQNGLAVIGGWARQSGVTCQIDQAVAIGRSVDGNLIYEVGCSDADGYWLEKAGDGWRLQSCETIALAGESCLFAARRA